MIKPEHSTHVNAESKSKSRSRWKVPTALGLAGVVVAGAGWFGLQKSGALSGTGDDAYAPSPVSVAAPAASSIANGATGVTPDTPLVLTAPAGETVGSVTVADAAAHSVPGTFSADHRSWTSAQNMRVADTYQVTAETGEAQNNGVNLQHMSFSTAQEQDSVEYADVYPVGDSTVGVAQPVVIEFAHPVTDRAAVERALTVYSNPPQPGSWGWLSSQRVDYRPENYWKPGTKVSVDIGMDGVDVGGGKFGTKDRQVNFTVGRDQETVVDVQSDQAAVYRDGQQVKSFPVSGGMPGLDTWGGTFAVIDKASDIAMDSRTAGLGDAYDIPDVKWDVHFTYSGTYVHSAPWSVGSQGVQNVSHGCVGTNPDAAEWFYDSTLPGDVIKVVGSPRTGALGNGFNEWQASWADWQTKSAL
jgi:lipoprotein-anchoring transpeptidase ErfK/SrfK